MPKVTLRGIKIDNLQTIDRWRLIPVVALLLGAAFIRVYHLASVPPGIASDSTIAIADALRVSRGISFPPTLGLEPEPFYRYLLAAWMFLTGPSEVTVMIFETLIALVTVALTYHAGRSLLRDWPWKHIGALVAAGAMAAIAPHVFLSRNIYRIILIPPLVLAAFITLLSAARTGRKSRWAAGGFFAACCIHVYPVGLVAPLWAIGFVIHYWITSRRQWQPALWTLVGMTPPLLVWLILLIMWPNRYQWTVGFSGASNSLQGLWAGVNGAIQAYFVVGHPLPNFDALTTPFLNPPLAVLAIIGIGLALSQWNKPQGALFLGGLLLFTIPGAITNDKTYPLRYSGCMPLLPLLAGWGTSASATALTTVLSQLAKLRPFIRPALTAGVILLVGMSLAVTHIAYQDTFSDPSRYADPADNFSVPHNYSLAFENALKYLTKVDRPTYMPLWLLDNSAAQYFLERDAYPNITTWARYGLKELPEGQFFMPGYWMYHMSAGDTSTARVLLLPAEKTIILLPGMGLPDSIAGPPPVAGETGVTEIEDPQYGWVLGWTRPVSGAAFHSEPLPPIDSLPEIGHGLRLLAIKPVADVQPGKVIRVLVEWLVTASQPADIFSVVQLVNSDFSAVPGGSSHDVLFYLYPSAMWQPGDIIPDWHEITISTDLPEGIYRWGAGVSAPPDYTRFQVTPPPGDYGPQLNDLRLLGAVRIPPVQPDKINAALPNDAVPLAGTFGQQIALEGYQLKQAATGWTITLYWRTLQKSPGPTGDYTIFVHMERGGKIIAQHDAKPNVPTWAWMRGELLVSSVTLTVAEPPDYIYVGMYSYPSLERLAVSQDGVAREDRRFLLWSNPGIP